MTLQAHQEIQPAVYGHCDTRFQHLAAALSEEIGSGGELGAAISVDVDGESVVDIWGGHTDRGQTKKWSERTIVNVWSCTKTISSLAALILVDRGLLDPFAPVARYWPEFRANGKQNVEVRHILGHTSGVSGWEAPFTTEDMYDWHKATAQLARQAPWWQPGSASGYHAQNQGHLVGELIRRLTGKTLKDFVRDEIAVPLDADIQIGARAEDDDRIAELVPPPVTTLPLDKLAEDDPRRKTFTAPMPDAAAANSASWRRADIGACNGHGNARSLTRALSAISLGGTANGVQLLLPSTVDLIFQEQANGVDKVLAVPLRWGMGFALPTHEVAHLVPNGRACFWGGWGGSIVVMDLDRRATIAYTMNKMANSFLGGARTSRYLTLVYDAIK